MSTPGLNVSIFIFSASTEASGSEAVGEGDLFSIIAHFLCRGQEEGKEERATAPTE